MSEEEARDNFEAQYGDIQQFWSPLRGGYITGLVNTFSYHD